MATYQRNNMKMACSTIPSQSSWKHPYFLKQLYEKSRTFSRFILRRHFICDWRAWIQAKLNLGTYFVYIHSYEWEEKYKTFIRFDSSIGSIEFLDGEEISKHY